MRRLSIAAALVALSAPSVAAEGEGQWLCIAEFAGGVRYDETAAKWTGTTFRADDRFVVKSTYRQVEKRFGVDSDIYDISISEFGTYNDPSPCKSNGGDGASTFPGMAVFTCYWNLQQVQINLENGRFMLIYQIGYVSGDDNNDNTPSITGGNCARF